MVSNIEPSKFTVAAPPLISKTPVCGIPEALLKTKLPLTVKDPVVRTTLETLPVLVLLPPIFRFPVTVALPALIFHDVTSEAVG